MNTKGTKFLAVLAVLTMAFAGFAVIADVQVSDATPAPADVVETEAGDVEFYPFQGGDNIMVTHNENVIKLEGIINNVQNDDEPFLSTYGKILIHFPWVENTAIVQTNSIMKGCFTGSDIVKEGSQYVKYAGYSDIDAGSAEQLEVYIPQDGSTVTIKIYDVGETEVERGTAVTAEAVKTAIAGKNPYITLNIDCSDVKTIITLADKDLGLPNNETSLGTTEIQYSGASDKELAIKADVSNNVMLKLNANVTLVSDSVGYAYNVGANTLTVAAEKQLTLNKGVWIDAGEIANNGTVTVYDPYLVPKITGAGVVNVEGYSGNPADSDATSIDQQAYTDANTDVIVSSAAVTDAEIPAGKALVITNTAGLTAESVIDVSASNSEATIIAAGATSFNVKIGTAQMAVTGFTGTATFAKGSIIINGIEAVGGSFALKDGDEVKLSGSVGALEFTFSGTGSAKVIVEAGKELSLGALTLSSNKISMEINGTVMGGTIANGTSKVTINDGAEILGTAISGSNITVYSGSDINAIGAVNWANVAGKDAASGTWSYDATGKILSLNNYNGTYNFGAFTNELAAIMLTGVNTVSYAFSEDFVDALGTAALFGNGALTDITTTTTGSLEVNVDVSKIQTGKLFKLGTFGVIYTGDLSIDGVAVTVAVTGSNNAWTASDIAEMNVFGIDADSVDIYQADLDIDVMGAFTAPNVTGLSASADGIQIRSCDDITVISAGVGVYSNTGLIVKATDLTVVANGKGFDVEGASALSNGAEVWTESGAAFSGNIDVYQESSLNVKGLEYMAGTLTNNGTVTISGESVIGGTIDNLATMTNEGTVWVYGGIVNTEGQFTNNGTITVIYQAVAEIDNTNKAITLATPPDLPSADTKAKVASITLSTVAGDTEWNYDGSATVKATVEFALTAADEGAGTTIPATSKEFAGTLTPSQTENKYNLVLRGGNATVTVNYDGTKPVVTVSGSIAVVKDDAAQVRDLEANAVDFAQNITGLIPATGADMYVEGGDFVNAGTVTVYSGTYAEATPFIAAGATYTGPLAVGSEDMYIAGKVTGDVTAAGSVEINGTLDGNLDTNTATVSGTVNGDITAKGTVTVSKTVKGNITTDANVTSTGKIEGDIVAKTGVNVKELVGNIEITSKTDDVNVIFYKMNGIITHNSVYNTDEPEPPATPTTATVTSTMVIDADSQGTTIILKGAVNKAGAVEGKPGYFVINKDSAAATEDKAVNITLTSGKLVVAETTNLMKGYAVVIESGTTLEISDKNATFNVAGAALKVSTGATKNYEEGADAPVNYGKVAYIMKFDVSGGYTVYSNIAYALENADDNSELTVGQSATVDTNVVVGTGITVIVPKGITLTFDGHSVDMKDGAKILIEETGRVVFNQTSENLGGDEYVYYTVSGTIEYDGNAIEFEGVRFAAAGANINGIAATETTESKLNTSLAFVQGSADIVKGIASGTVALGNTAYALTVADNEAGKLTPFSATFVVAEGALFEANTITDVCGTAKLSEAGSSVIINVTLPSCVMVDGTLNLLNSTSINGRYIGDGEVVIAATKNVSIYKGEEINEDVEADDVPAVVSVKFVDTTDAENGYVLEGVSPSLTANVVITSTTGNLMTISGAFNMGTVTALTTAMLDNLTVDDGGVLVADSVKLVNNSTAKGILKTKALDLNTKVLSYDVTYTDGAYTVYTMAANIDFDDITDIVIDGSKFNAAQQDLFGDVIDLSGKDVNLAVKEGTTLVLVKPMIIGTAPTSLGAGASLSGTIEIALDAYLIVYPDVDISGATITDDDALAAAKSVFDIEGTTYLTIFANGGDIDLADVSAGITPEIKGYTFTRWEAYNAPGEAIPAGTFVGDSNVTASLVAQKVVVKAVFLDGVQYYCNGVLFDAVGIDTKVTVGSIFTAKIIDYSRYQGTPLVNGQNAFEVTENVTLNVTGVSPVEPTPEPEPAGMTLTEILLIVLVILIAVMVVVLLIRLNRS